MDIFKRVIELGGYQIVNDTKNWKIIVDEYDFPSTCTNAAYSIKMMYMKYLSEFENVYIWKNEVDLERFKNIRSSYTVNRLAPAKISTPATKNLSKRKFDDSDSLSTPSKISYSNLLETATDSSRATNSYLIGNTQSSRVFIHDFLGGPKSRIVLSLYSGLPNEIEWASKQLIRFSYECSEGYVVESMAPFLVQAILDLLERCRNTVINNSQKKFSMESSPSDNDENYIDDLEEYYNTNIVSRQSEDKRKNLPESLVKKVVCQNGKSFWDNSCNDLYASLVTVLLNLAIINKENSAFFGKFDALLDEIEFWINESVGVDKIWYEVCINYIELLETLCESANLECLGKYTRFIKPISKLYLESEDRCMISATGNFLMGIIIRVSIAEQKIAAGLSKADSAISSKLICKVINEMNIENVISKSMEMIMSINTDDRKVATISAGLLIELLKIAEKSSKLQKTIANETTIFDKNIIPKTLNKQLVNAVIMWYDLAEYKRECIEDEFYIAQIQGVIGKDSRIEYEEIKRLISMIFHVLVELDNINSADQDKSSESATEKNSRAELSFLGGIGLDDNSNMSKVNNNGEKKGGIRMHLGNESVELLANIAINIPSYHSHMFLKKSVF
ncbi:AT-rich interactive domain-containing protein 2 [Smittium culicis]|uniref:AT-rich interactive domain-containing protein 2 n=1 Tax=Smittium culicis TaxID=133412 RepID=A0A1R1XNT4_9FUNG|nr:AT-rich interactive domain-containing protein 2 [Smittium culicis]